jgi:hypothetical protein
MRYILLFFILANGEMGFCQTKKEEKTLIGFTCSFSGSASNSVKEFTRLLDKKDYKKICSQLRSKNPARKFLAVIICEKLKELGKIVLSEENLTSINLIHNNEDVISVCSGCTYYEKLTIKDLLNKTKGHEIYDYAEYWLTQHIK